MTSDMTPVIDKLTKVGSDPPVWLVDIGGKRLELSTEQLQNYQKFQRACLAKINRVFGSVRQRDWLSTLADAMDKLQHETPPPAAEEDSI